MSGRDEASRLLKGTAQAGIRGALCASRRRVERCCAFCHVLNSPIKYAFASQSATSAAMGSESAPYCGSKTAWMLCTTAMRCSTALLFGLRMLWKSPLLSPAAYLTLTRRVAQISRHLMVSIVVPSRSRKPNRRHRRAQGHSRAGKSAVKTS